MRQCFLGALVRHQQRRQNLQRLGRGRIELLPGARRLERELGHPRLVRDLDRAARNARIAGAPGEVEESLRCERQVAALQGNLAEQELVEHRLVEVALGRLRDVFGLRDRGAACDRQARRGDDQPNRSFHLDSTHLRYVWCPAQARFPHAGASRS